MAQRLAPPELKIELYEGIDRLPYYNVDIDVPDALPDEVVRWRSSIIEADAMLVALPEYNFGPSGVMKNALDWATRPMPTHPMRDKVMAIVTSGGKRGGPNAQAWATGILPLLGVHLVTDPEISLAMGAEYVSADGTTTNPEVEDLVAARLANMVAELERLSQADG